MSNLKRILVMLLLIFPSICYFLTFHVSMKGTQQQEYFTTDVDNNNNNQSSALNFRNQIQQIEEQMLLLQGMQAEIHAMKAGQGFEPNREQQQQPKQQQQQRIPLQTTTTRTNNLAELLRNGKLQYIFGFSPGRAGSQTMQQVLEMEGCPWDSIGGFEQQEPQEKEMTSYLGIAKRNNSDICAYTRNTLLPFLEQKRGQGAVYIDAGHWHNRGPILECLAALLRSKVAFVLLRRNRYSVAHSFSFNGFVTPCFPTAANQEKVKIPGVSYCPIEKTTPISLPLQREIWNKFTSFQQFLWQVDDLEMRFTKFRSAYPDSHYLEITWTLGHELAQALSKLRTQQLGCQNYFDEAPNPFDDTFQGMNCTNFIYQDLEYQRLVNYSDEKKRILFQQRPQELIVHECRETKKQIQTVIDSLTSSTTQQQQQQQQQWALK